MSREFRCPKCRRTLVTFIVVSSNDALRVYEKQNVNCDICKSKMDNEVKSYKEPLYSFDRTVMTGVTMFDGKSFIDCRPKEIKMFLSGLLISGFARVLKIYNENDKLMFSVSFHPLEGKLTKFESDIKESKTRRIRAPRLRRTRRD